MTLFLTWSIEHEMVLVLRTVTACKCMIIKCLVLKARACTNELTSIITQGNGIKGSVYTRLEGGGTAFAWFAVNKVGGSACRGDFVPEEFVHAPCDALLCVWVQASAREAGAGRAALEAVLQGHEGSQWQPEWHLPQADSWTRGRLPDVH